MRKYFSLLLATILFFFSLESPVAYAQMGDGNANDNRKTLETAADDTADTKDGDNTKDAADTKDGDNTKDATDTEDGNRTIDAADTQFDDNTKDHAKDIAAEGNTQNSPEEQANRYDFSEKEDLMSSENGGLDAFTKSFALTTKASVSNFTLEYQEEHDRIILRYKTSAETSYVDILVDGRPVETDYSKAYTSYSYELPDDAEGKTYVFQIVPYELRIVDGTSEEIVGTPSASKSFAVPYKKAVITDDDADYDLAKQYLTIEWSGTGISYMDIYLDGSSKPIASKVPGNSYSTTIAWEPLSIHTYRLVPYNKAGAKGAERTVSLTVDDYTAVIDLLDVEYVEKTKQIVIKWDGTNVKCVDIYLNDELIAEDYEKEECRVKYTPQAGASYLITVCPYNIRGSEGEEEEETLVLGEFEIPSIKKLVRTSCNDIDNNKNYTGFSKPAIHVQWIAESNAYYEIYRASKNTRTSYSCIARLKATQNGLFTYEDQSARIGKNYYKIRRIIREDKYVNQEVSTALSDPKEASLTLPKPKVDIVLSGKGNITLSINGKKNFVSGYAIYRKEQNSSYKMIAETTDNVYIDTDTEFGKQYSYKIKSYYYDTKTKQKDYSAAAMVKIRNRVGSFTVQARQVSNQKIKLSWDKAANAEGYEIYYKSGMPGDSYKYLKTTKKRTYRATLKAGKQYCFLIKAFKHIDSDKIYFNTAYTELKTGFTSPRNFRVAKTSFSYDNPKRILTRKDKLVWDKVYGASGYYIDVYNPKTKKYSVYKKIKGAGHTCYVVTNKLTATTDSFTYRIRSYSKDREAIGDSLEIKVQIGAVSGVKVSKSGSSAKISWQQVPGADSYRIYRSNGRNLTLVGTTEKLNYTDKGLSIGVTYLYYVQAVSDAFKSQGALSLPASYTYRLSNVKQLSASVLDKQSIKLQWTAEDNISGYIIYWREKGSREYQVLAKIGGSNTSYTHTNLTAGKTYYYKVTRLKLNAGGVNTESGGAKTSITLKKNKTKKPVPTSLSPRKSNTP